MSPSPRNLAVIGSGPKGVAIAAKNSVLRKLGIGKPVVVHIFDDQGPGANWSGANGFTDGICALGTPPEKDVGFPYASTCWAQASDDVDRAMLEYSWQAFLTLGKSGSMRYHSWIDRGRPTPSHGDWGRYLGWAMTEALASGTCQLHRERVDEIGLSDEGWTITTGGRQIGDRFDGVVVTGPGNPKTISSGPVDNDRVFDGRSMWQYLDRLSALRPATGLPSVAIVGAGETAAAAAIGVLRVLGEKTRVDVVAKHPVVYTRGENFLENAVYTSGGSVLWDALPDEQRREFIKRTDRGVFSVHAVDLLRTASLVPSFGTAITATTVGPKAKLVIEYPGTPPDRMAPEYDVVVIATGFDPESFALGLLDNPTRTLVTAHAGSRSLESLIDEDLSIEGFDGRLHLPMLAAVRQGPGFPNLSCLGTVSDRVLASYV